MEETPVLFKSVNVAIFNTHSRKATPSESIVKTVREQRIDFHLKKRLVFAFGDVASDNGFENMIKTQGLKGHCLASNRLFSKY